MTNPLQTYHIAIDPAGNPMWETADYDVVRTLQKARATLKGAPWTEMKRLGYRLGTATVEAPRRGSWRQMNEYIPDPIECAEAAAERAYDALSLPRGMMKCPACGKPFNPENEGGLVSMNPYVMPVCGECLEAEFDDFMKKTATPTGETLALPEK